MEKELNDVKIISEGREGGGEGDSEFSVTRIRNNGKEWVDVFQTFATGEKNAKVEDDDVIQIDTSKTWENVEWDDVKADMAARLTKGEELLEDEKIDCYESETSEKWDQFYKRFQESFFKNRSYLGHEFPELSGVGSISPIVNLNCHQWENLSCPIEIGCGVGNSIMPLMELNPDKFFIGFDCSQNAIELFQKREDLNKEKCHLFVLDPTMENMDTRIPDNSIDVAILVFVLSAIAPKHMPNVLNQIYKTLKPGGILLFRDYGQYDMTHLRFYAKKTPNKMAENYYRRADGTFAYFFEKEMTNQLFSSSGFVCESTSYDTRLLYNRKRMLKMYRVWIRGRFRKPINELKV